MDFFHLGEVPCNHEIMRDALSLIQRLPVMKTDIFREDFYNVSLFSVLRKFQVSPSPTPPPPQTKLQNPNEYLLYA